MVAELDVLAGGERGGIEEGVAGGGEEDIIAEAVFQRGVGAAGAEDAGAQDIGVGDAGAGAEERRGAGQAQEFLYARGADEALRHAGIAGGQRGQHIVEAGDGGEVDAGVGLHVAVVGGDEQERVGAGERTLGAGEEGVDLGEVKRGDAAFGAVHVAVGVVVGPVGVGIGPPGGAGEGAEVPKDAFETFHYSVTDADGDSATSSLTIMLEYKGEIG